MNALLERLGAFDGQPSPIAKYVIASETTLEVVELLLARLWGPDEAVPKEVRADVMSRLNDAGLSGAESVNVSACEAFAGRVEECETAIQDLKRQVSSLQRQLQMQGDVVKVADSLERTLNETSAVLERRVCACEESQRGTVARVDDAVERMNEGIAGKANAERVDELSADVSRLKEIEEERKRKEEEERKKIGVFDSDGGSRLNGIIAYLTGVCGGNVADKGEVAVTASGAGQFDPKNVVDLESDSYFYTEDKPGSWVCYDFKGRRVTPTSYSIKSYPNGPGGFHPKSWVLEVSDDGSEHSWQVVDRRDNNNDLNARSVRRNFPIAAVVGRRFRFVRLRMTGKGHGGDDCLEISALEIFGTLSHE